MISPVIWLNTSRETRLKIKDILGLSRSGNAEVVNNRVVCDGHTPQDLMGITVEKLQMVLNSKETDIYQLFNEMVYSLENPQEVPIIEVNEAPEEKVVETIEINDINAEEAVKPKGRPKKIK